METELKCSLEKKNRKQKAPEPNYILLLIYESMLKVKENARFY